ncbi:hypothetical protein FACS1894185_3930 [Betaproteobacteria bacterium]|nr:hypothetical protein FACS1894185_3930 [Betaproteobacteria bacterium]
MEAKTKNPRTKKTKEEIIELIVVIMLGITAVATAWSAWQGGLHGSQMDQKYTKSNNLNAEANSTYNEGVQNLNNDLMLWNQLMGLHIDYAFAEGKSDLEETEKLEYKISQIMEDSVTEDFAAAIAWAEGFEEYVSPFDNKDFVETYYAASVVVFEEAEAMLEAGNANNTHGDNQGLVSVIYAVVLFLLGISSSFKGLKEKYILLGVSGVGFVGATAFMLTIPLVFP